MARREANPTSNRPTAVLVIAILHFVFGGFGLLGTVCGGAYLLVISLIPLPQPPGQAKIPTYADIMSAIDEKAPGFIAVTIGGMVFSLVLSVLMIVAGFGLVRMRPRGRTLSIVYATLSILTTLLSFVYNLVVAMPVMPGVMEQMLPTGAAGPGNPQQAQAMQNMMRSIFNMSYYAGLATPFIQMIYPVSVLIVMYLPRVRAAFREGPPTAAEVVPDETDRFEARER
jgi:hypothetical protein